MTKGFIAKRRSFKIRKIDRMCDTLFKEVLAHLHKIGQDFFDIQYIQNIGCLMRVILIKQSIWQ